MLAVVVCIFAVLWLPYRAYVVYNSFAAHRYEDQWLMLFCRLMVYTNSAINPILYNAMSAKFCRAFRRLLLCGRAETLLPGSLGTTTSGAESLASSLGGSLGLATRQRGLKCVSEKKQLDGRLKTATGTTGQLSTAVL